MNYVVLVVREPWHERLAGRMIAKGEVILDPAEVARVRAERPSHVIPRLAVEHEVELIEAAIAASKPVAPEFPASGE